MTLYFFNAESMLESLRKVHIAQGLKSRLEQYDLLGPPSDSPLGKVKFVSNRITQMKFRMTRVCKS